MAIHLNVTFCGQIKKEEKEVICAVFSAQLAVDLELLCVGINEETGAV